MQLVEESLCNSITSDEKETYYSFHSKADYLSNKEREYSFQHSYEIPLHNQDTRHTNSNESHGSPNFLDMVKSHSPIKMVSARIIKSQSLSALSIYRESNKSLRSFKSISNLKLIKLPFKFHEFQNPYFRKETKGKKHFYDDDLSLYLTEEVYSRVIFPQHWIKKHREAQEYSL